MGLFSKAPRCPPMTACISCRNYFEPRHDDKFAEYCFECRKPRKERQDKIDLVTEWAQENYEKLEPKAKKWREQRDKVCKKMFSKHLETIRRQQEAMQPMPSHLQGQAYGSSSPLLGMLGGAAYRWPR